jgi:branched-chain amino acid transport system substrate-binding protein
MRRRKGFAIALAAALTAAALAAALAGRAAPAQAAAADLASCTKVNLGMMAPLTGPAAFLGQEQLSWVQFAVARFNKQFGTRFGVVQGDTQLSASLARTVARRFVSDKSIIGVVGGSTSQSVISSGKLFAKANLVSVSGSATRVTLTNGDFPTFFRVVPHDGVQAPSIVNFVTGKLKANKVMVIDSQDDYSVPLADAIEKGLKRKGVTVDRQSVSASETDFSTIATNVDSDTDVVVFATQTASAAQTLSQQLLEQGKKAVVFGTDGAYSPTVYKPKHGYVSVFAKDLRFDPAAKAIVAEYRKFSKGKAFGSFGPPSYMAAWVIMEAARKACADDKISRAEVVANVRKTNVPSILGGTIRFTRRGDVIGAKFFIYEVTNGQYKNVG